MRGGALCLLLAASLGAPSATWATEKKKGRSQMESVAVLEDPKAAAQAKVEAARALRGTTEPRALLALAAALDITHEGVQEAALDSLRASGGAGLFVSELRRSGATTAERAQAARVLRYLQDPTSVPALALALADSADQVRVEAAHALAVFGAGEAQPALVRALGDPSSEVRYFAVLAVSTVPGEAGRTALQARLKLEADPGVKAELERVLGSP